MNKSDRLIGIYSHGKSGTTSIFRSLGSQTKRPVVRFHMLNPSKVRTKIAHREQRGLKIGRSLRNSRRFSENLNLLEGAQLITMTRDPIAAAVSSFFYRLAKQDDALLRASIATGDPLPLIKSYSFDFDTIERLYLSWFETEIGATLNFDIYDHPFDKALGFQVYRREKFDLLLAKLECDDHLIEKAICSFLSLDSFRLQRRNTALEKPYSKLYESFKRCFVPEPDLVHRIYSHHSIQHFYTEEEISRFLRRWTRS